MERRRPRRHWHRGSLLSHQTQKPKKNFKNEKASQGKKLASIVAKNLSPKARRWMIVIRKDTKKFMALELIACMRVLSCLSW